MSENQLSASKDSETREPVFAVLYCLFRAGLYDEAYEYSQNKGEDAIKLGYYIKTYKDNNNELDRSECNDVVQMLNLSGM